MEKLQSSCKVCGQSSETQCINKQNKYIILKYIGFVFSDLISLLNSDHTFIRI